MNETERDFMAKLFSAPTEDVDPPAALVPTSSGQQVLMESSFGDRQEEAATLVWKLIQEKGDEPLTPLEESLITFAATLGLGALAVIGVTHATKVAFNTINKWYQAYKADEVKKAVPAVVPSAVFLTEKVLKKIVKKDLTSIWKILKEIDDNARGGNLKPFLTAQVLGYKAATASEIASVRGSIAQLRGIFKKLEDAQDKLNQWAKLKQGEIQFQKKDLLDWLSKKVGGEVGATTYSSAPPVVQEQLNLAMTMRQVALNASYWRLPSGAEKVGSSAELGGSVSVPDESRGTTSRIWTGIMTEVANRIPFEYGGGLKPKDIRARDVEVTISNIGVEGQTTFQFTGNYTLLFHPQKDQPSHVTVQLHIIDKVTFHRGKLGSTEHSWKVKNISFPKIKSELGDDKEK